MKGNREIELLAKVFYIFGYSIVALSAVILGGLYKILSLFTPKEVKKNEVSNKTSGKHE